MLESCYVPVPMHTLLRRSKQLMSSEQAISHTAIYHLIYLFVLPVGGPLLHEGGHALLLVLQREHGVEDASLEAQALLQAHLVGRVDLHSMHAYIHSAIDIAQIHTHTHKYIYIHTYTTDTHRER